MDTIECIICLNTISKNEIFTLTCCKNDVHIYCLNDWVKKNITNKNIGKCFICSQENSILEALVSYNSCIYNNNNIIVDNSNELLINNNYTNSIINHNNNINNDIILVNDTNMLDISYATDKRLYYLVISIKLIFLIFFSTLLMLLLYIIT